MSPVSPQTRPPGADATCSPRRRGPAVEAGLYRTNQELGSTVSLQVSTAWVRTRPEPEPHPQAQVMSSCCVCVQVEDEEARTNQRPDFILLANHSPDREEPVLYPDQWADRVSLAGR